MGFVLAEKADEFGKLSEEDRKDLYIKSLAKIFGKEALDVEYYFDYSFAKE